MKDINYSFKETTVTCDHCGKELVVDTTQFSETQETMKDKGWFSRNVKGEWFDFCCKSCFEKFLRGENKNA